MSVQPSATMHGMLGGRVSVWLMRETDIRIEGLLRGYDEYYNLVLDDSVEVDTKSSSKQEIGRIVLKGDTVGLVHAIAV